MIKQLIIVAGGKGLRMGLDLPKQFVQIKGRSILEHTIASFEPWVAIENMVLVLPKDEVGRWETLSKNSPYAQIKIALGGSTRFQSVKSGLNQLKTEGVVAIHDAVRPFASSDTIVAAFQSAEQQGNGIPTIPLTSSIRRVFEGVSRAENRDNFRMVQTPQCFQYAVISEAYKQSESDTFTDDASVVESLGKKINLTEGNVENIKITTPHDLHLAEALLD